MNKEKTTAPGSPQGTTASAPSEKPGVRSKLRARRTRLRKRLTIRRRLLVSNILMIAVPILVAAVLLGILAVVGKHIIMSIYLPDLGLTEHGSGANSLDHYEEVLHGFAEVGIALAAVCGIIVLVAIFFTNKFLINFVFRRIREPLDLIEGSVDRIREGNLDTYIEYDRDDEFRPVCESLNLMQAKLKESAARTQAETQARKELFAGMSHDIRSPLTSIRGYTEALLDGVAQTPEQQQQYLLRIREKELDVERMVEQLYLVSKMELDDFPVNPEPIAAADFLQKTVEDNPLEGLETEVDIDPTITVKADPALLRRITVNILENSYKYKDKATGSLRITAEQAPAGARQPSQPGGSPAPTSSSAAPSQPGGSPAPTSTSAAPADVVLSFTDDGPGVPEAQLQKIFETFYRTDPARSNPAGGSGLGLSVIKKAAARMHGSTAAENAPGGGLTIKITLPRADAETPRV